MKNSIRIAAVFVMMILAMGCTDMDDAQTRHNAPALNDGQTACLLDFLNAPTTRLSTLDEEAGLDRRAAQSVISARDGGEFVRRAQVASLKWVGQAQMDKLDSFAAGWCQHQPASALAGSFDGVVFTHGEARAVIALVNNTPQAALEHLLDFNPEASKRIVEQRTQRPFVYLLDVAQIDGIDATELEMLRSITRLP